MSQLDDLVRELEEAAEQLRGGELDVEQAAATVERCAELAATIGQQLDDAAREPDDAIPGQEELL